MVGLTGVIVATLGMAVDLDVGAGQTYASIQGAVGDAQAGDVIRVHSGTYVEDLNLGSSGAMDSPIRIEAVDPGQATVQGVIDLDGSYWELVDLVIETTGGGDGVQVRGDFNLFERVDLSGGTSDGIDGSGTGNVVRDSRIHLFDAGDADAHCIVLNPGAQDWVIEGSELFDCSGDGVQLFSQDPERSIINTTIEGNHIYYTGAIGRTENAIDIKNADGLFIRNNYMHDFPDNKTIVVQKGPINIEVMCNSMGNGFTGVEFRGEQGGTVEDVVFAYNLMDGYDQYALKFDGTAGGAVYNNTIKNVTGDGLRIEGAGLSSGAVQNNLFIAVNQVDGGGFTADHNGFFNVGGNDIASGTDVDADPMLDAECRLVDGSPMVDAGADVGFMFQGRAPDIGWDELGGDPCAALPGGEDGGSDDGGSDGGSGGPGDDGMPTAGDGGSGGGDGADSGPTGGPGTADGGGDGGSGDGSDSGCGCRSTGGAPWILLVVLAGVRFRRPGRASRR